MQAVLSKHEADGTTETKEYHDADGTTETKEYHDAVGVFYSRHLCRLDPPPAEVAEVFSALQNNPSVYMTM